MIRRRGLVYSIAFSALCGAWASSAHAQKSALPEPQLSVEELERQLARIEEEIVSAESRLELARTQWAGELLERESERTKLSGELLELALDSKRLEREDGEVSSTLPRLESASRLAADAFDAVVTSSRRTAERLSLHLAEIPGSEDAARDVREILNVLSASPQRADAVASITRLLALVDRVHRDATSVSVRDLDILTATGRVESVSLLSAGALAFAYRTRNGRIGLAVASPADASGFRWTEDLDPEVGRSVARAIASVSGDGDGDGGGDGGGDTVLIPFDVSGRLQVDSSRSETVGEFLLSGGPVMIPLGVVALLALLLIAERVWVIHRCGGNGDRLIERVLETCREGRFADAEDLCRRHGSVVGRTLGACLRVHERGVHAMEDGIEEQLLHELPGLQRFLSGLAVLGSVAPLLGLLGTVTGIIQTFGVIKVFQTTDPSLLAGGISEALVTTATGLVVAIPILLIHSALRGKVDGIIGESEKHAATLLTTLAAPRNADGEPTADKSG